MNGVINRNWLGYKNSMLIQACRNYQNKVYEDNVTDMFDTNGYKAVAVYICSLVSPVVSNSASVYSSQLTVRFGSSDTPPTGRENNLGQPWTTSSLHYVSVTVGEATWEDNTISRTYTVTVQNQAADQGVIREYGLFALGQRAANGNSAESAILLYHEILDEPVTLNPLETATISFTVSMTLTEPTSGWVAPT